MVGQEVDIENDGFEFQWVNKAALYDVVFLVCPIAIFAAPYCIFNINEIEQIAIFSTFKVTSYVW